MQEFKVETSSLPARYGHHAASAVNIITKSGTNNFKGSAFEFNRDYHFNARNAFATTRDSLRRNQFGGVIGGPVMKNKAFFFGGYHGQIEKTNPPTSISYIPTRAMLNGDFTAFASPACNGGVQRNLGGGFVNNQIDPSRLSPIAQNFAKYLPVDQADQCGKVQYGIPNNNTEHRALTKIDYTLNNQQSIFTRYLYAVYDNPATYDGKNVLTLSRTGQNNQAHSIVVGHNFVLASFVNALRVTYNKTLNDRPLPEYFTATDLGSKVYSPLPGYMGINVTGNGFSVGNGGTNPGYFDSDGWQLANDVDILRGNHQISFGGNWIHTKIETLNNRPTNGAFTFNGQTTGLSLADFMMGALSGGFLQGNPVYDYDDHDYVGAYVQDDWRIAPNLTVNAGVRWEPFIPLRNTYSWASNFDLARFNAGIKSTVYSPATRAIRAAARPTARWRSLRRALAPSGRRAATATPVSAPAGACSTTRRTCSSTRASPTTRHGARRSRCRIRRAAGPIRTRTIPAAIPSRRSTPAGRRSRSRHSASTSTRRWTSSRPRCSSGTSARKSSSATGCCRRPTSATSRRTCGAPRN
jgi:hypothetical protein